MTGIPASSSTSSSETRAHGFDALRGVAVLLMVLDHLVRLIAETAWIIWTVPRLALGIFMVLFGCLYRGWSWRHLNIAIAALATWPMLHELYGTEVPILVVLLLVLPLMGFATRWPVAVACVAFIQAAYWEIGWSGYEPGFVLGFIAVGTLARRCTASRTLVPSQKVQC